MLKQQNFPMNATNMNAPGGGLRISPEQKYAN